MPLADAAGRVLAEPATAVVDLPPFPSSAMDGYAVRVGRHAGTLPVVGRIAAGAPAARPLGAGEAMGIATGGVVPDGADAVIQHERVVESDNQVEIPHAVAVGDNIRPIGPGRDRRSSGRCRRRAARHLRRSAPSPPPGSPRSSAPGARGSLC